MIDLDKDIELYKSKVAFYESQNTRGEYNVTVRELKYVIETLETLRSEIKTGDLISRSALKTELEVYRHTRNYKSDEEEAQNFLLDNILEDIDNAPPVKPIKQCKYCKHCGNEDYCSNCHSDHSLFEYYKRQQGAWVEKTFENDDEEGTKSTSFVCSCCGASRVAGLGNAKFCYNCGADMRKGVTE